jgi:hypothetical protein
MNILIESVIVFVLVYFIFYYVIASGGKKYNPKKIPVELLYLKKIYKVNIKKEEYTGFIHICTILNSFIVTFIYIILIYLINSWWIRIIVGIVLLILMMIICYGILARYYLKKGSR